ncbi:unnamed protein product [Darwinula stevensoni]|uniref:Tropomyosin n=1 Tax=Darwinula stevensoni TaxID=69355 RepID=A0A7R8X3N0_9CRUS|nr:unnamed protein product [Darwinula stevensoni]CAG0882724.1 unnamed protein product [Darwinula stevensoni]
MDAIKKKMQAMKLEKDNAMDRADTLEQQSKDSNLRAEKAEEEVRALQKKMQQVENDLDQVQEQLTQANTKLEEKDKALQNRGRTGRMSANQDVRGGHVEALQHGGVQRQLQDGCAGAGTYSLSETRAWTCTGFTPRILPTAATETVRPEDTEDSTDSLSRASSTSDLGFSESSDIFADEASATTGSHARNCTVFTSGDYDDPETAELAKLRCPSVCTEVLSERHRRKARYSADYPGLAFGSSIFSSNTMMKFNIIKNELHNVMNVQLKRGSLLDVLKKKMRQTKEEMEKYRDDYDEATRLLQVEKLRREEAEAEVAALNRRIQLLEEDLERSEERLGTCTTKLAEASQAADESERIRKALENRTNMEDDRVAILEAQLAQAKLIAEEADKKYEEVLENRSLSDEERMDALENQLKEARFMAEEADRKYDEVARKLAMVEADLERAEERAETGESKIVELEEELRVVGNNLKSLEVSEEKANQREEAYKEQIKSLTGRLKQATQREEDYEGQIKALSSRLKEAEARAEFAERSVQKLQKEVDRLEDELIQEKEKYKGLSDELDQTFTELSGY